MGRKREASRARIENLQVARGSLPDRQTAEIYPIRIRSIQVRLWWWDCMFKIYWNLLKLLQNIPDGSFYLLSHKEQWSFTFSDMPWAVAAIVWLGHSKRNSLGSSFPISTKLHRNVSTDYLKSSYWTDSLILLMSRDNHVSKINFPIYSSQMVTAHDLAVCGRHLP